jgi:hypothetical protein
MPLKKGSSRKVMSQNISEVMHSYDRTGRIGTSRPKSRKKAVKQAVAISYSEARRSRKK